MAIQHIVLFEWKSDASDADIDKAMTGTVALVSKIDGVEGVQWGPNITSRAGNIKTAAIVTLRDKVVLEAYGPHPNHQEALGLLNPIAENILAVDFEI